MTSNPANDWLDQQLATGLGSAPVADFGAWQTKFPEACQHLNPILTQQTHTRRRLGRRLLQFSAAVACLVIGFWWLSPGKVDNAVFADVLKKVSESKSMTWKETFYKRVTSADGQRNWLETETAEFAYLEPGLYRDTRFDSDGNVGSVSIVDTLKKQGLSYSLRKKTATLTNLVIESRDPRGPFGWIRDAIEKHGVRQIGRRELKGKEINAFRVEWKYEDRPQSIEFWLDPESKQIVRFMTPGTNLFDPETDPDRNHKREEKWKTKTGLAGVYHDIVYDAKLDRSLFSLDIPEGYTGNTIGRPTVTEAEMIEFLGAVAAFNANVFPDDSRGLGVSSEEFNKASEKPKDERTAAEQKLIDLHHKYVMANLNFMPIRHFIDDHTAPNTFQYLGKGVPLGDAGRIVCWYKLKGTGKYRAVYADLKVQGIDPKDLPLPVEP